MALGFEPALHVLRSDAVGAAVADEYRGHLTEAAPPSAASMRVALATNCFGGARRPVIPAGMTQKNPRHPTPP